jgi:mono/diheme cytochrome c family protein
MNTKINLSILILVGSLFFVACGGDAEKSASGTGSEAKTESKESGALDADLQAGKESFEMTCASCHGEKGAGDGAAASALNPKPRNFKAPASEWKNGPSLAGITKTLNEGIKGGSMVAYKHLGDETIAQIAKYVVHLHEN